MVMPCLKSMSWDDIRHVVARLNPPLFDLIEAINPNAQHKLYKIRYPFGAEILRHGIFHVPNQYSAFVPINDSTVNPAVRSALLYNLNSNPVCMPLQNNSEIYLELDNMIIPYQKIQPGDLLGTWGVLDHYCFNTASYHPESIWSMSAGARSIFMLAKIGDQTFHRRLQQEYKLKSTAPKTLSDQWGVFKEINRQHPAGKEWEFELLCFSKSWFEHQEDPLWQPLYHYLLKRSWSGTNFLRNQSFWDLIFSVIRKEQKIPPSSYINDMVKHLHAIACGAALGFAPQLNEEDAPIRLLQEVYVNGAYKLKEYLPVIMTPQRFDGKRPVYFSLNNMTALEFSEKSTKRASLIQDITHLDHALKLYAQGIKTSQFRFEQTEFYKKIMQTRFDCFYDGNSDRDAIRPIADIYKEDVSFSNIFAKTNNSLFPQRGHFIRGCVRIMHDALL